MSVAQLGRALAFPHPSRAAASGLLAVGGDLSSARLLLAYRSGIFPWYNAPPILWFSPDPRMVLRPGRARVTRRLARTLRQARFRVTLDRAFRQVLHACAATPRHGEHGTWITRDMMRAFETLHTQGHAHSCEVWLRAGDGGGDGWQLVGGLYGLAIGRAFFGESMFHRARDASKIAFVTLQQQLAAWDFELFDCQLPTPHLASLGARTMPRAQYLALLARAVAHNSRTTAWRFES